MNKIIIWVIVALLAVIGIWLIVRNRGGADNVANNPVPTTTDLSTSDVTSSSTDNLRNIPVSGTQATADEIIVDKPKLGDKIKSPIEVTGKARGSWYFEASAPVMVIDATGKILGRGFIQAQGDWMTSNFVPFKGTITFESTQADGGAVIFMNDNPSGDEARAKYIAVPVFFDK